MKKRILAILLAMTLGMSGSITALASTQMIVSETQEMADDVLILGTEDEDKEQDTSLIDMQEPSTASVDAGITISEPTDESSSGTNSIPIEDFEKVQEIKDMEERLAGSENLESDYSEAEDEMPLDSAEDTREVSSASGDYGAYKKENIKWEYSNGVLTISGSGEMLEQTRPATYPWSKYELAKVIINAGVTSISRDAFAESNVIEVQLPDTLLKIGEGAFSRCAQLTTINIPDSVREISTEAFFMCTSLSNIHIPKDLTVINEGVFAGSGLTSVTIPENVSEIGIRAFSTLAKLERVTILGTNVVLKYNSFRDCQKLTAVKCKDVSIIEYNAFYNCKGLVSVEIPGVTEIGNCAFQHDSSLVSVVIGNDLKVIEGNAFSGCTSLREFIMPDTIESIGYMAFYRCENLIDIGTLGKVTIISDYAFGDCHKLKKVEIPTGVTIVGKCAFTNCYELEYTGIPDTVETICDFAFYKCNKFSEVKIPGSVKIIGKSSFGDCDGLRKVYIPASVTSIDSDAFFGCKKLIIYGKVGSAAHKYADLASNVTFVDMDAKEVKITYNPNGGSVSANPQTILTGTAYGNMPIPKRKGYQFDGWYTEKKAGDRIIESSIVTNTSDHILYAHWSLNKYKISYNLDGGRNSGDNPKSYTIKSKTITLKKPTKTGYRFSGWYTSSAYKTEVTQIKTGSTGNKKLYAKWTSNTYTIKYNKNGATSGKMANTKSCKYGKYIKLRKNTFKRKGYTFLGWSTKPNATKATYKNSQSVRNLTKKNGGIVTLYAVWKKK